NKKAVIKMRKHDKIARALYSIFSIMVLFFGCFSSSSNNKNEKNDIVTVYDSNNQEIAKFTSEKDITYFSELVGKSVENMDEDNIMSTLFHGVPKDAKISFKYAFTHTKNNGQKTTVNFFVYENYPYITLKGIPIISPLTWELSEKDNSFLQNPIEHKNK
ncbi:MAG: hypothetical protein P1P59_11615, partial [Treponemataceae bacterium]